MLWSIVCVYVRKEWDEETQSEKKKQKEKLKEAMEIEMKMEKKDNYRIRDCVAGMRYIVCVCSMKLEMLEMDICCCCNNFGRLKCTVYGQRVGTWFLN